jgi:hypothetical protein
MNFEGKHYDRIIGDEDPDQEYLDKFHIEAGSVAIDGFELKKTAREIEVINFTEDALDTFLEEFNTKRRTKIPIENVHVLRKGGTEAAIKGARTGSANSISFSITVDEFANDVDFAMIVFHEMTHLKSFQSRVNIPAEDILNRPRRNGVKVYGKKLDNEEGFERGEYLGGLDEALNSFLERRFFDEHIKDSDFFKEEDKLNRMSYSRKQEVVSVNKVIDKIVSANKEGLIRQDVLQIMMDAKFNGRLLPLARLVKNSIGMDEMKKLFEIDKKVVSVPKANEL